MSFGTSFRKELPLKIFFCYIKKFIKLIKKIIDFLCEFFFPQFFSLVNFILNSNLLIDLDKKPELNKFEILIIQLNLECAIRILAKLKQKTRTNI